VGLPTHDKVLPDSTPRLRPLEASRSRQARVRPAPRRDEGGEIDGFRFKSVLAMIVSGTYVWRGPADGCPGRRATARSLASTDRGRVGGDRYDLRAPKPDRGSSSDGWPWSRTVRSGVKRARNGAGMDLVSIGGTLLRRWYILVPVVLLGLAGAYHVAATTESEYTATGTFLLTANPLEANDADPEPGESGPADLDGASDATLLAAILGLDTRYIAQNADSESVFALTMIDDRTLQVEAWADDPEALEALLDELTEQASASLAAGLRISVAGRTSPIPAIEADAARGDEQAGMVIQIVGGDAAGGGGALPPEYVGRVLSELMLSRSALEEVALERSGARYSVTMQTQDLAPIVTVSAIASSPQDAIDAYQRTVEVASARLQRIHDSHQVAEGQRLLLAPLVEPSGAPMTSDQGRRPALAIVALALVCGAALAVMVDGVTRRRREQHLFSSADEFGPVFERAVTSEVEPGRSEPPQRGDGSRSTPLGAR
jgi:hypothetical protein